jgi:hypothetical protein
MQQLRKLRVRNKKVGGRESIDTVPLARERFKGQSYPIQDEPEGEVGFQYKMSLERMAC